MPLCVCFNNLNRWPQRGRQTLSKEAKRPRFTTSNSVFCRLRHVVIWSYRDKKSKRTQPDIQPGSNQMGVMDTGWTPMKMNDSRSNHVHSPPTRNLKTTHLISSHLSSVKRQIRDLHSLLRLNNGASAEIHRMLSAAALHVVPSLQRCRCRRFSRWDCGR